MAGLASWVYQSHPRNRFVLLSTALTAACGGSSLLAREKPARVRDSFCQRAERATITAGTSRTVKPWTSRTSKADRSVPTKCWSASPVASAAHQTSWSNPLPSARPTYSWLWKANVTVAQLRLPGSCSRSSWTNRARRWPTSVVNYPVRGKELLGRCFLGRKGYRVGW